MNQRHRIIWIALTVIMCSFQLKAQNVTDATVLITPILNNDSSVTATINISVADTIDIAQVEVQLGSTSGGVEFYNAVFDYEVTLQPPLSYYRYGQHISIVLGPIQSAPFYFARVRTKAQNGAWSNPYEFVFN